MTPGWSPRTILRFAALAALLLCPAQAAAERFFILDLDGRRLEGTPLAFDETRVLLLCRDGQLERFAPHDVGSFREIASGFRPYSQAEIRGQLMREFGEGFEVSGAGRYLVVHPAGKRDVWAPRFDALYRSFVHYFSARGWQLEQPRFPLVAVVYPRQADFQQQARREGLTSSQVLGYYSPWTNRILMYDSTASGGDWTQDAETIIHEASHQAAFNSGVHNRFGDAPRWVVEGLGTMFEARGVWQSQSHPHLADRINRAQLAAWRRSSASRPKDALARVVSSDRPFSSDANAAYAEAWALSFFLVETQPRKYFEFLTRTADKPPFEAYTAPQRLQDFTDIFGSDLIMLDARMQRFLAGLK